MSLEKSIHFLIQYNTVLIESLVGLILLFVGYLSYRSYSASRDQELGISPSSGVDMSKLEAMINKLLEKASHVPAPAAGATAASAEPPAGASATATPDPNLLAEIDKLKAELTAKAQELEKARNSATAAEAAGAAAPPGFTAEEKAKMESTLRELESKLKEYEIISEDIADLSFYKEENTALKKQIESLGGKIPTEGAPAAEAAGAAAPTPAPEPTPEPEPIPVPDAPEPIPAPDIPEPEPPVVEAAAPELEAAPELAPTPAEPATPDKTGVVDQGILDEFNQALFEAQKASGGTATKTSKPAPKANAGFDLDKMVAEASNLKVPEGQDVKNSLEQEIDPEKLAGEAAKTVPVTNDEKDLMGQFENFVKKEK